MADKKGNDYHKWYLRSCLSTPDLYTINEYEHRPQPGVRTVVNIDNTATDGGTRRTTAPPSFQPDDFPALSDTISEPAEVGRSDEYRRARDTARAHLDPVHTTTTRPTGLPGDGTPPPRPQPTQFLQLAYVPPNHATDEGENPWNQDKRLEVVRQSPPSASVRANPSQSSTTTAAYGNVDPTLGTTTTGNEPTPCTTNQAEPSAPAQGSTGTKTQTTAGGSIDPGRTSGVPSTVKTGFPQHPGQSKGHLPTQAQARNDGPGHPAAPNTRGLLPLPPGLRPIHEQANAARGRGRRRSPRTTDAGNNFRSRSSERRRPPSPPSAKGRDHQPHPRTSHGHLQPTTASGLTSQGTSGQTAAGSATEQGPVQRTQSDPRIHGPGQHHGRTAIQTGKPLTVLRDDGDETATSAQPSGGTPAGNTPMAYRPYQPGQAERIDYSITGPTGMPILAYEIEDFLNNSSSTSEDLFSSSSNETEADHQVAVADIHQHGTSPTEPEAGSPDASSAPRAHLIHRDVLATGATRRHTGIGDITQPDTGRSQTTTGNNAQQQQGSDLTWWPDPAPVPPTNLDTNTAVSWSVCVPQPGTTTTAQQSATYAGQQQQQQHPHQQQDYSWNQQGGQQQYSTAYHGQGYTGQQYIPVHAAPQPVYFAYPHAGTQYGPAHMVAAPYTGHALQGTAAPVMAQYAPIQYQEHTITGHAPTGGTGGTGSHVPTNAAQLADTRQQHPTNAAVATGSWDNTQDNTGGTTTAHIPERQKISNTTEAIQETQQGTTESSAGTQHRPTTANTQATSQRPTGNEPTINGQTTNEPEAGRNVRQQHAVTFRPSPTTTPRPAEPTHQQQQADMAWDRLNREPRLQKITLDRRPAEEAQRRLEARLAEWRSPEEDQPSRSTLHRDRPGQQRTAQQEWRKQDPIGTPRSRLAQPMDLTTPPTVRRETSNGSGLAQPPIDWHLYIFRPTLVDFACTFPEKTQFNTLIASQKDKLDKCICRAMRRLFDRWHNGETPRGYHKTALNALTMAGLSRDTAEHAFKLANLIRDQRELLLHMTEIMRFCQGNLPECEYRHQGDNGLQLATFKEKYRQMEMAAVNAIEYHDRTIREIRRQSCCFYDLLHRLKDERTSHAHTFGLVRGDLQTQCLHHYCCLAVITAMVAAAVTGAIHGWLNLNPMPILLLISISLAAYLTYKTMRTSARHRFPNKRGDGETAHGNVYCHLAARRTNDGGANSAGQRQLATDFAYLDITPEEDTMTEPPRRSRYYQPRGTRSEPDHGDMYGRRAQSTTARSAAAEAHEEDVIARLQPIIREQQSRARRTRQHDGDDTEEPEDDDGMTSYPPTEAATATTSRTRPTTFLDEFIPKNQPRRNPIPRSFLSTATRETQLDRYRQNRNHDIYAALEEEHDLYLGPADEVNTGPPTTEVQQTWPATYKDLCSRLGGFNPDMIPPNPHHPGLLAEAQALIRDINQGDKEAKPPSTREVEMRTRQLEIFHELVGNMPLEQATYLRYCFVIARLYLQFLSTEKTRNGLHFRMPEFGTRPRPNTWAIHKANLVTDTLEAFYDAWDTIVDFSSSEGLSFQGFKSLLRMTLKGPFQTPMRGILQDAKSPQQLQGKLSLYYSTTIEQEAKRQLSTFRREQHETIHSAFVRARAHIINVSHRFPAQSREHMVNERCLEILKTLAQAASSTIATQLDKKINKLQEAGRQIDMDKVLTYVAELEWQYKHIQHKVTDAPIYIRSFNDKNTAANAEAQFTPEEVAVRAAELTTKAVLPLLKTASGTKDGSSPNRSKARAEAAPYSRTSSRESQRSSAASSRDSSTSSERSQAGTPQTPPSSTGTNKSYTKHNQDNRGRSGYDYRSKNKENRSGSTYQPSRKRSRSDDGKAWPTQQKETRGRQDQSRLVDTRKAHRRGNKLWSPESLAAIPPNQAFVNMEYDGSSGLAYYPPQAWRIDKLPPHYAAPYLQVQQPQMQMAAPYATQMAQLALPPPPPQPPAQAAPSPETPMQFQEATFNLLKEMLNKQSKQDATLEFLLKAQQRRSRDNSQTRAPRGKNQKKNKEQQEESAASDQSRPATPPAGATAEGHPFPQ